MLGSSRGLGLAIAQTLAAEGASVILAGRNVAALEEAAAGIRAAGGAASTQLLDLADRASVLAALDVLERQPIDILVNNSGGPPPGRSRRCAPEQWSRQFETMVSAIFLVTSRLLPGMRARKFGRIVNVVSSGVAQPIPNLGISNALRASIVGWAKTLATEVAAEGITVNSVLPGRIHTQRVDELDTAAAAPYRRVAWRPSPRPRRPPSRWAAMARRRSSPTSSPSWRARGRAMSPARPCASTAARSGASDDGEP